MLTNERFGRPCRNPFDTERARGHRLVGPCEQGRPRERHWVIAGVVVAVLAAAVSAYASYEQGQTAQATAKFNKKQAENAALAQRQAAQIEAENKREEGRRFAAIARANIGGAGVMPTEGTPLLVELENAEKIKLNEARILYAGEVGAQQFQNEAAITSFIGRRQARTSYIQAGASLLSGVAAGAGGYARAGGGGGGGYSAGAPYYGYTP